MASRITFASLLFLAASCSDSEADFCRGAPAGDVLVSYGRTSDVFISDVSADAEHVYWVDTFRGKVRRISKVDRSIETIADTPSPWRLAVDGESVYWINYDGGVRKALKSGGAISEIAPGRSCDYPPCGNAIAVDQSNVYWVNRTDTGTHLWSSPKSGGMPLELSAQGLVDSRDIVVDEQSVYWMAAFLDFTVGTNRAKVRRTPKGGGAFETVASLEFLGAGLAADAVNLYIVKSDGVWRVPKDASGAVLIAAAPAGTVDYRAIATDGSQVYVLESRSLLRAAAQGGELVPIACDSGLRAYRVALDDLNAYWSDDETNSIFVVQK